MQTSVVVKHQVSVTVFGALNRSNTFQIWQRGAQVGNPLGAGSL